MANLIKYNRKAPSVTKYFSTTMVFRIAAPNLILSALEAVLDAKVGQTQY